MGFIRRYFESREKAPADPGLLLRDGRRQGSEAMIRGEDQHASEAGRTVRRRRQGSTIRQNHWKG